MKATYPGTHYNGCSYFAAVDKKISESQLLSLTVFGVPTKNGRQGAAVQEMMDLAKTNYYNPNWIYQNGKSATQVLVKQTNP